MCAEPTDGALHVLDARLFIHVEPVINGDANVAFGRVIEDSANTLPTLVAFLPAPAVNINNGGTRCIAVFFRHREVEFPSVIPFAISDIRQDGNAIGSSLQQVFRGHRGLVGIAVGRLLGVLRYGGDGYEKCQHRGRKSSYSLYNGLSFHVEGGSTLSQHSSQ